MGQAVSAATSTVPPGCRLYSSQSSFLKAAKASEKVIYRVERTADGRVYTTRTVHAMQGTVCVYVAVISFQNVDTPAGKVLEYGTPMPDLGGRGPEDIEVDNVQKFQASIVDPSVPLLQLGAEDRAFDFRPLGMEMSSQPSQFRIRTFVRAPPLSTRDPLVHLAALAYLSDEFSFGPALAANPKAVGKGMRNVAMGASLTHNVSFHNPQALVDEWMIIERETSWGAEGRVLVYQRLWNLKSGQLVLSGTQEAVVRLKDTKL